MFQAMFLTIIRSTRLYLQYLVVFTQVAAGWCIGWVEASVSTHPRHFWNLPWRGFTQQGTPDTHTHTHTDTHTLRFRNRAASFVPQWLIGSQSRPPVIDRTCEQVSLQDVAFHLPIVIHTVLYTYCVRHLHGWPAGRSLRCGSSAGWPSCLPHSE